MWHIELLISGIEGFRAQLLRIEERQRNLYAENPKLYKEMLKSADEYKFIREQLDIWCKQRYIDDAKDFIKAHQKLVDIFTREGYNENGTMKLTPSDIEVMNKKIEEMK